MFLDESAFDDEHIDKPTSKYRQASITSSRHRELDVDSVSSDEDEKYGNEKNAEVASIQVTNSPTSSRARMLAQQRELQRARRQSSLQSGGVVRSSVDSAGSSGATGQQFTPAIRQFSAPKSVKESSDVTNAAKSEFQREKAKKNRSSSQQGGRSSSDRYQNNNDIDRNSRDKRNYYDKDDDSRDGGRFKQERYDSYSHDRRQNNSGRGGGSSRGGRIDYNDDRSDRGNRQHGYHDDRNNRYDNRNDRYDDYDRYYDNRNGGRDYDDRYNNGKYNGNERYDDSRHGGYGDRGRGNRGNRTNYEDRGYNNGGDNWDRERYNERNRGRNDRDPRYTDSYDKRGGKSSPEGQRRGERGEREQWRGMNSDHDRQPRRDNRERNRESTNNREVENELPDTSDLKSFIRSPIKKECGIVQCYIKRNKSGPSNKLFPLYTLHLKRGDVFLMASKKRPKNKTSNYLISSEVSDLNKGSNNYVGKLRSNFMGTEFQVFDDGVNPKDCDPDELSSSNGQVRNELAVITYAANVLGSKGPRKMQVAIPEIDEFGHIVKIRDYSGTKSGEQDMLTKLKEKNHKDIRPLINKPPRWNEQVGAYVLNFNGRVTMASVKNFQLVDPEDDRNVILQFGRVAKDEFTMDLQWPMSPYQAFAITLSSFDSKIACD